MTAILAVLVWTPVSSHCVCLAHLQVTKFICRHRKLVSDCRSHPEFIQVPYIIRLAHIERGTSNSFSCPNRMRLSGAILGCIDFTGVISGRSYNLIWYQDITETKRMLSEREIHYGQYGFAVHLSVQRSDCHLTSTWMKHQRTWWGPADAPKSFMNDFTHFWVVREENIPQSLVQSFSWRT